MWVRRWWSPPRSRSLDQTVDEVFDIGLAVVPPTANDDDGRDEADLLWIGAPVGGAHHGYAPGHGGRLAATSRSKTSIHACYDEVVEIAEDLKQGPFAEGADALG